MTTKIIKNSGAIKVLIALIAALTMSLSLFAATEPFKFKVENDWGSGFQGSITITNTGPSVLKNWQVQFDLPYKITDLWNARLVSKNNNTYTIKYPSWQSSISPGASYTFGFVASPGNVSTFPSNMKINGSPTQNTNRPPVAVSDTVTIDEGVPATIKVLANDTDPDGDTLSVTAVSTPANGTIFNDINSIRYYPKAGFYGKDSFSYTISDGKGGSATANVEVTVNPIIKINNPPTAVNDSATTQKNQEVEINILANDSDVDGDQISLSAASTPSSGTTRIANGKVYYMPNTDFTGNDSFTYTITDTKGATAKGTVSVTVKGETLNPQVSFRVKDSWYDGFTGEITITNTTSSDFKDWTLSFDMPHKITNLWNGIITYSSANHYATKNENWNGNVKVGASVTIGFTAQKSGAISEPSNIVLNGTPIGTPIGIPSGIAAVNDTYSTTQGTALTVSPMTNDKGEGLRLISVTPSTNNGITKISNSDIIYTPASVFSGNDSFTYTIEDKYGNTANGLVSIYVSPAPKPQAPVVNNDTVYTIIDTQLAITPLSNDTDPAGETLTITNTTTPANGTISKSGSTITYTPKSGFTGTDTFEYTAANTSGLTATGLITVFIKKTPTVISRKIVGYWQNWNDSRYIRLRDVSPNYNIINVAFAMPKSDTDMTIEFPLDLSGTTKADFIADIKKLQSEGRKVLISLGGAASPAVRLNTSTDKQKFVTSLIGIINEYGFDGLDIDLEGASVGLNSGDNDFKNPTTPSMVNLISAIKEIVNYFGSDKFMLTTAPETAYVQGGYGGYNGFWGAYLPLLYALRNEIDLIHVQYYNSGSNYGADGKPYNPGTPDFLVALTEGLLQGFPVAYNNNNIFPALRPDQVAFGLLTVASEGSGYMQWSEIKKALDYITKGIPYGGSYVLKKSGGYSDFGGIMGWSINYDKSTNNYSFANSAYNYFSGTTTPPQKDKTAPAVAFTTLTNGQIIKLSVLSPVSIAISATDAGGIASSSISVEGKTYNGLNAEWTPSAFGSYKIIAYAEDASGNITAVNITVQIAQDTSVIPPVSSKKQIVGYVPQWDAWKGTDYQLPTLGMHNQLNIDYKKYTMLNYSFFGVAKDGSLLSGDFRNKDPNADQEPAALLYGDVYSSWDPWILYGDVLPVGTDSFRVDPNGRSPGLFKLCKDNNVKLMASIGGWSMSKHFSAMAADSAKKANFLRDCKKLIDMGFDGIDIDWEYPGPFPGMNFTGSQADFQNFTNLMKDIRGTIGYGKTLTAAFSCSPAKLAGFNFAELDLYMDYYNMMTYDMEGGWSGNAGHNSPLYNDNGFSWDQTFKYMTQQKGVKGEKINMGAAFYGRGVVTSGTAALGAPTVQKLQNNPPDGWINTAADFTNWALFQGAPYYYYIKNNSSGWTRVWDDKAKVPYLIKGNYFLSYDDPESIKLKADYIVLNNAGGAIVWETFGDMEFSGGISYLYGNKLPKANTVKTELLDVLHENLNKTAAPDVAGYFHTSGNQIVNSAGTPVRIAGVNWFGFESTDFTAHGLYSVSYKDTMNQMKALGFNTIRLPFSNEMFDSGKMPKNIDYYSNPELQGLTPIQVMDKIVDYAGTIGLKIILDHHRSSAGDGATDDGLWYNAKYPESRWISDWKMLAGRYSNTTTVIGADLHNEPHGSANWGQGGATDWKAAAERCGNEILKVNPNCLILVEGIEVYNNEYYWWGGNLMGAKDYPVILDVSNRLVYSPHAYPNSIWAQPWFSDPVYPANLPAKWDKTWGFIYKNNIAPVLIGEFGSKFQDPKDILWMNTFSTYLSSMTPSGKQGVSWTWWSWNPESGDTGGILQDNWKTVNQSKVDYLRPLMFSLDN